MIRKVPWKGYEGIAKDCDDKTIRIELSSKCKTITLPRDIVGLLGGNDEEIERYNNALLGAKTPLHYGGKSGVLNAQSPNYHGQGV